MNEDVWWNGPFNNWNNITIIDIHEGVTSISPTVFGSLSNLTTAILPKSLQISTCNPFHDCPLLTNITRFFL